MRRSTLIALSTVSLSAIASAASPAAAQSQEQQTDAGAVNTQIECADIVDPAERQQCVDQQAPEASAEAEGGAPGGQEIVVTGSRIPRANFDTPAPSIVVDSEQIENRGFETIGQALNEQPSFGVPGSSPVGGQAGSFGSGQSFVNFLGLGSQRTLVLINGRRFVSSNTASIFGPSSSGLQVDLNSINTNLVDRIETIAIGGAPIYGSDAIAGTVNILLKRKYEGISVDGQYGISSRGDAANYRVRAIAGRNFLDGRANLTLSGEYNKGKGLLYNDRELTARGLFYRNCRPEDNTGFRQCLFENRRIPSLSESGVLLVGGGVFGLDFPLSPDQQKLIFGAEGFNFGVQDAAGNQLAFDARGNLIPIDFGRRIGSARGFSIDFEGGNGFNLNNTQQLLTDTERYNATLLGGYELTDNVRLFGEAWFAHSGATNLRDQPVYNTGLFDEPGTPDGSIIVSIDNPFLTPAQRQTIVDSINNNPFSDQNFLGVNQDYFFLGRANTDLISGRAESKTNIYRFVAGLDGTVGLIGRQFNWEVVGNYGRAQTRGTEPALVQQNFANAVNAVRDANGNIVCAPGYTNATIPTLSSTCAPLNLFGTGRISQAARDYVTAIADPSSRNEQYDFVASIAGPVFDLPGGALDIAAGYEHRQEKTSFNPGAFYAGFIDPQTGKREQFGRSIPILPVSGKFNTDEVFGEMTAQVISPSNNIPFLNRLELHGAARWVDHSTAGGDLTWTTEGRFAPVRDITFRGNFTRAIRSPAITELFNPSSEFFTFAVDPCDQNNLNSGPDPATRQKNCAAAGIPPDFSSLSNQRSFPGAIAGNVALDNEKSDAFSLGVVLTPRFVPTLRVSVDYLDVKLDNAITNFSSTAVVSACYDSPDFPNNEFCSRLSRDPDTFQLDFVQQSYFNAATYRYKGYLGAISYTRDLPFLGSNGTLGINATYQYLDTLTLQSTRASNPTQLDRTIGYPRHSAVVNFNVRSGPVLFTTALNYTGKVSQAANEPKNFREFPKLDAVMFVNSSIVFNVQDRYTLRFIVDNVFDTKPPFPAPAFGGLVSYFPGILGRYFRVGAGVNF